MKTPVPIKRHEALVSFSKDHHSGLLLVWKIRLGIQDRIDAERISEYVLCSFKEELESHFKEEEELLFCRLPENDKLRKQAEKDHRVISELADVMRERKKDISLLILFADKLEKHIRFEERELFNHIQDYMPAIELEEAAKRFSVCNLEDGKIWADRFWEKK